MFQETTPGGSTSGPDFTDGKDTIKELADLSNINLIKAQNLLSQFSGDILATFTQTRERVYELQTSIANAIPGVQRLGGGIKNVSETISGVALASRRNVIASTEDIEGLFAATQILGGTAESLSNSFLNVGIGISKISEELQGSIKYVQSIGGNAKSVMKDVTDNMDQMNRFQFEDGVKGLTKMAAQASMLRFSMKETFTLADKVLTPDGAIKTAAAFQRLGLAVGGLGDPLQLMNQALNDPSGLQDSLVEVSKKFTFFDNKTKSFKINPEGVLTLRALADQTGISAEEMTKMGLAASELDRRLSSISPKINIDEEDKQYLANIATMTKDGEYVVNIKNKEGDPQLKKLGDITQTEFDKLIEEQKKQPKTLENTALAQLSNSEIIKNDLRAIRGVIAGGIVTADPIQMMNENVREFTTEIMGGILDKIKIDTVREKVSDVFKIDDNKDKIASLLTKGEFDADSIMNTLFPKDEIKNLGADAINELGKVAGAIGTKLKTMFENFNSPTPVTTTTDVPPVTTGGISAYGVQTATSSPIFTQPSIPRNTSVNVGGEVNVNVKIPNLPVGFTPAEIEQAKQMIAEALSTPFFIKHIKTIMNEDPDYGPNRK